MDDIWLQLRQKSGESRIPGDGYRIIDTPAKIDRRETENILLLVLPSLTSGSKDIDLMAGRAQSPAEEPDCCYYPIGEGFITVGEEDHFQAESPHDDTNYALFRPFARFLIEWFPEGNSFFYRTGGAGRQIHV